jgi:hypothetical protein
MSARSSGWMAFIQPNPRQSSDDCPVNADQLSCTRSTDPSAAVIHTIALAASIRARYRASSPSRADDEADHAVLVGTIEVCVDFDRFGAAS